MKATAPKLTSERKKILIAVKTYPQPSAKHNETVCTAGMLKEGRWVRLYPIPYRFMDRKSRFRKYQWVEAKIFAILETQDQRATELLEI